MTGERSAERHIADLLMAEAPTRGPVGLVDSVLAITITRSPRPRWLILIRESSMRLDHRPAFGSPVVRSAAMVVTAVLLALVAAATVVVGAASLHTPEPSLIPAERGVFSRTGSLSHDPGDEWTVTLLDDGSVLLIGGYHDSPTAELWDPTSGSWDAVGTSIGRYAHTATLLSDGRVLVVGGAVGSNPGPIPCGDCTSDELILGAEIWDPATRTFSPAGSISIALAKEVQSSIRPTAELLSGDRVLVGRGRTAEIWDPLTMSFSPAGNLGDVPGMPLGTLLRDGRVFVMGHDPARPPAPQYHTWDPTTGSFSPTGTPVDPQRQGGVATLLQDGRILLTGGASWPLGAPHRGSGNAHVPYTAEIWDPSTNVFSATGSMDGRGRWGTGTLLPDGRVLVVYGSGAEIFELG